MKFSNTALQFLVAFEALSAMNVRSGVCAQSVVVDRTSENNGDSIGRFSPNGINNLRVVVDPVTGDDESSSTTGTMHHAVADAAVSDVLLGILPDGSGSRFSPSGIHVVVDSVTRGAESSSKTVTMHHTVADTTVSDVLLETLPADGSGSRFSSSGINKLHRTVVDPVTRGDGSSSKTGIMHHTVADGTASDFKLGTLPANSIGRFSSSGINNLRRTVVDPVTRGDGSSSKTGTMHHTVASDVLLNTLLVDSGGRFSSTSMDTLAWDDVQQSKQDRSAASNGSLVPPSDIGNHHAVVDAFRKTIEDLEARLARAENSLEYYILSVAVGGNEDLKDHKDGLPQRHRKLSKKTGSSDPPIPLPPSLDGASGEIEGVYMYTNKCNNVFQVTIDCDRFGEEDPDLCSYSEFSQGTLLATWEPGSELLPGGDLFFLPNAAIPEDGIINPDIVCEFSGTFRRSSLMVEEEDGSNQLKLQPLPLASSNGCETTTINLQLVVKGTMKKSDDDNETILELDFSNDFGFTYYTDNKECLRSYIGQKVNEGKDNGQRALALNGIDDKNTSNNSVVRRHLLRFSRVVGFFCKSCRSPSTKAPTFAPTTKPRTPKPTFAPTTKPPTPNPTPVETIDVQECVDALPAFSVYKGNNCDWITKDEGKNMAKRCNKSSSLGVVYDLCPFTCAKVGLGQCVPIDPTSQCNAEDGEVAFDKCQCREQTVKKNTACSNVPVDCVDGFERDTGLTCEMACVGECCTGGTKSHETPCTSFTGLIHRDGSCTGSQACQSGTVDEVKGPSCTGTAACRGGKIGVVKESCNGEYACYQAEVGLIEGSCNGKLPIRYDCYGIHATSIVNGEVSGEFDPREICRDECRSSEEEVGSKQKCLRECDYL